MNKAPREPVIETVYSALGSDMYGIANSLVALAEAQNAQSVGDLIDLTRRNVNSVGNLQFVTTQSNRHERMNIEKDSFSELTVIVDRELVSEAVQRLLAA